MTTMPRKSTALGVALIAILCGCLTAAVAMLGVL